MDFGCNEFAKFIETLYDFFNDIEICFLSGAIVFDNEGQWLYRSLVKGQRLTKNCKNVATRTKAGTHRSFLTQADFRHDRLGAGAMADEYMIRDPVSAKQYDKTIEPALVYLCDKKCRATPTPAECMPGNREPKGIAMFYPFDVIKADDQTVSIDYLFMKLEQYATSLAHPIQASKHMAHFIARKVGHKKKMTHNARREDDPIDPVNEDNDKDAIIRYYIANGATLEQIDHVSQKIDFFNTNIRVGNEVYIPSEILEMVLRTKIPAKSRMQNAIKKVIAMARFQPSHEPGSNLWIRNHVALVKHSGRSPFAGVPCMKATYLNSSDSPTTYTREQLMTMAKYMGLAVSKDMSKKQICDIISPPRH